MFEAYKIGVTLSLTNHVSRGLMAMSKDFARTEAQATLLEKRIKSIQSQALKGGLYFAAGAGMLMLLKGPYEEAKKLAQAKADFENLNLGAMANSEVYAKAATMSHQILGTTITENIKQIQDLHTAFGDLPKALETANMFTKLSVVAKVANGGAPVDGIINAAAKALEHRGGKVVNNPAAFDTEANMMAQVMLATKMRVSPKDYLTASGTGKMAYQMYDKEFIYGNYAGLMSINGGARTGTEGMTAFSSLVGGHMDQKGKNFLAEIGLWQEGFSKKRLGIMQQSMVGMSPEERKIAIASMGGQLALAGGLNDADAELFAHRPDLFVAKMVPLIKARFGLDMTDEQVALMVAKNLNRSTGNDLGTQITMASKLSKDTAIFNKTKTIGGAYNDYLKSPEGAEEAASAAWKNFLAVFGSIYLPQITKGLLSLAKGLDNLSQWVDKNQGLVKGLVYAFTALAGGLLIKGSILLLTAAFRGLGLSLLFNAVGGATGIASLGTSLLTLTGGFLPLAAGIVAIGAALYGIKWIYDYIQRPDTVAQKNQKAFAAKADAHYKAFNNQSIGDFSIASAKNRPIQVHSTIKIGEKTLIETVTTHLNKAASKPQSGIGSFDPTQMAPHPSFNYAR